MASSISRMLIEKIGRKMLRSIRDHSKGSTRGFMEMMLNFGSEHFQTGFFKRAQQALCDESSTYYQLLHAAAANVDHDRLMRFGMNIGYNGVIGGSRKIRQIEAAEGFNIPWALHLEIEGASFEKHTEDYDSLIRQGRELGIFTWFVHADELNDALCRMIAAHDDCAFVVMLDSEKIDADAIERAEKVKHLVLSVSADEKAKAICRRLSELKMLYIVHVRYAQHNLAEIMTDDLLCEAQSLNAPIIFFVPRKGCTDKTRSAVREYVIEKRKNPRFMTLPCDMVQDVLTVDRVISGDSCSAGFYADGFFVSSSKARQTEQWNMFEMPLKQILASGLKK